MKKKIVNGFLSFVTIMTLLMAHSAYGRGMVLCIGEQNHFKIESKNIVNYDKCSPDCSDNIPFNICLLPNSKCGSCKDIEPSEVGLIPSAIHKYRAYYQTPISPAEIQGFAEHFPNDDISFRACRHNENHGLTNNNITNILSAAVIIC